LTRLGKLHSAYQLVALAENHNRNENDALTIDSEYLEVIAIRH
jgi:hypothetical protein